MSRGIVFSLSVIASAVFCVSAGNAAVPAGAVRGTFSIGSLASFDEKSNYIVGTGVWCAWRRDHVIVSVRLRNASVETIEGTVKPRYWIARGSEHGSGFTSGKDFKLRGGEARTMVMDAGKPKNTPVRARIGRCAPYLWLVD